MIMFWVVAIVVFIVLELATPSALISIWFAVGSFAAFVLAWLGMELWVQIVLFFLVSIASMLVVRPMSTRYLRGNIVPTNADRFIGEIGVVVESIKDDKWGSIKVNGTQWSAVEVNHETVEIGGKVKIVAIEGAKMLVKKMS